MSDASYAVAYGGADVGDNCFATVRAVDGGIVAWLAQREKRRARATRADVRFQGIAVIGSESFAIASRSPDSTVLNGSTFASPGFALTTAGTRSKQYTS